jgi:hypothetical protein
MEENWLHTPRKGRDGVGKVNDNDIDGKRVEEAL